MQAALDELIAGGLASRSGGSVSLVHDLIRAAADKRLSADTRRRLHRAWAETLEAVAQGDLGTLRSALEHRRAAEMPTVDLALRLVRSPRRRWLGAEGLALVGTIADEADPTDPGRPGPPRRRQLPSLQSWARIESRMNGGRCCRTSCRRVRPGSARCWVPHGPHTSSTWSRRVGLAIERARAEATEVREPDRARRSRGRGHHLAQASTAGRLAAGAAGRAAGPTPRGRDGRRGPPSWG